MDYLQQRSAEDFQANVDTHSPTQFGDITPNGLLRFTSSAAIETGDNIGGEGTVAAPCGCISGNIGINYWNEWSNWGNPDSNVFINGVYTVPPTLASMHGGGAAPTVYQQPPDKADGLRPYWQGTFDAAGWWTVWAMIGDDDGAISGIAGFANVFSQRGKGVEVVGDSSTFPQGEDFLQWPFWNSNDEVDANIYANVGQGGNDVPSQYQVQEGNVSTWGPFDEDDFLPGGNRDCFLNGLAADYWGDNFNKVPAKIPWYSWTYEIHPSPSLVPILPNGLAPADLEELHINKGWAENGIANNYVEIRNTTSPGATDNELLVRYYISQEYSHNTIADWNLYNKALYIQINGNTQDIDGSVVGEGQPSFDFDLIDQHHDHEDTRIVSILGLGDSTRVRSRVERGGFNDQQDINNISGRVNNNESTRIAIITVKSGEGKYFQKIPYLTGSKKFKLLLRNEASNNYVFDLIYQNTDNIFESDDVKLYLNCKELTTKIPTTSIYKVTYGDDIVNHTGETRNICVHGEPETEFELLLTKATISTLDPGEDGYDELSDNIISIYEESILDSNFSNSTSVRNDDRVFKQIKRTIGSDGRYYFRQKFPNVTTETQYKIHIKCSSYSKDILEWDIEDGWEDHYTKTLTQYLNPVLTLKATVGSNYAITHLNGAATSLDDGVDHTVSYTGRPNTSGVEWNRRTRINKSFTISYTINGAGSKPFIANRVPHFSKGHEFNDNNTPTSVNGTPPGFFIKSDWTNTNPIKNNGTEINISNIRSVLSVDPSGSVTNGICTISFRVNIEKWGTRSVTMDLDLDKVLTTS